jgi:hypothetical protein
MRVTRSASWPLAEKGCVAKLASVLPRAAAPPFYADPRSAPVADRLLTRALWLDPLLAREGQMSVHLRRREVIAALGGAAAWPLAARAQQGVRRIGLLMPLDENDPEGKRRYSAFTQALAGLGWTDGRNVRMDLRWFGDDTNRIRALAQELVGRDRAG